MKYSIAGILLAAVFVFPSFANAQEATTTAPVSQSDVRVLLLELQSKLQELLIQYVSVLQEELAAQRADIAEIKANTSRANKDDSSRSSSTGNSQDEVAEAEEEEDEPEAVPFEVYKVVYEPNDNLKDIYIRSNKSIDVSTIDMDNRGPNYFEATLDKKLEGSCLIVKGVKKCDTYVMRAKPSGTFELGTYSIKFESTDGDKYSGSVNVTEYGE